MIWLMMVMIKGIEEDDEIINKTYAMVNKTYAMLIKTYNLISRLDTDTLYYLYMNLSVEHAILWTTDKDIEDKVVNISKTVGLIYDSVLSCVATIGFFVFVFIVYIIYLICVRGKRKEKDDAVYV
jgi:predicted nucleic acid-binding protein